MAVRRIPVFEARRDPKATEPPALVTVAADGLGPGASRTCAAYAWISDSGHYGAHAQSTQVRIYIAEITKDSVSAALRCAFQAVNSLWPAHPDTRLELLLPASAAAYARAWLDGKGSMPPGYDDRPGYRLADLPKLATALSARNDRITVRDADGGVLPAAARSLASLAAQSFRDGASGIRDGRNLIQVRADTALADLSR